MSLMIKVNRLRRIIFKLIKKEALDNTQQQEIEKIIKSLSKETTPVKNDLILKGEPS